MEYLMDDPELREAGIASLARETWSAQRRVETLIVVLTDALREVDEYTAEHSQETVELAVRVAEELQLPEEQIELVSQVAALHDIGKVGVPMELLLKPGPLDNDELATMRTHPVVGERILGGIPELAEIARGIRHEHERWDGAGYPDGLAGEEIPFTSRIVLACDAWHAMTSKRPYKRPLKARMALDELQTNAGTQFDPVVTEGLLAVVGDEFKRAA